eukprot:SAG25_NODE_6876_length_522_cov_0.971631_2_plen_98_part_01
MPYVPPHAKRAARHKGRKAPNRTKFMTKTTAKGAYRKGKKRNFQKRRAPFVETKRRVHSIMNGFNNNDDGTPSTEYQDVVGGLTIPNNDAFTLLDLSS